jgi:predicted transcriptional regulator
MEGDSFLPPNLKALGDDNLAGIRRSDFSEAMKKNGKNGTKKKKRSRKKRRVVWLRKKN